MMESGSSTYEYTPLDASRRQIRLLHLLPSPSSANHTGTSCSNDEGLALPLSGPQVDSSGQADINYTDDIHCTFSHVSLDDDPEYEALSYVWGDQTDLITIYVHGHPFLITQNLFDALFYMRQTTKRILWADAICINQNDPVERASQILQMGSVFGQASTVVIYLGAWEDAGIAFRFIEAVGTEPLKHYHDTSSMYAEMQALLPDFVPESATRYLEEFFGRPWWSRVWTVQEYVLAKRTVFQSSQYLLEGSHVHDLKAGLDGHFTCCIRGASAVASWVNPNSPKLRAALTQNVAIDALSKSQYNGVFPPLYVAVWFRSRQCSDPLDKVYGVLGLIDQALQLRMRPDYNSIPKAVYTNAAVTWITDSRTLDVLSHVYGERSRVLDVPTYVPDLSTLMDTYSQIRCQFWASVSETHFHAAQDSEADMSVCSLLEATTYAVFIDTVLKTVNEDMHANWVYTNRNEHESSNPCFHTRYKSLSSACWQTICGGVVPCFNTESGETNYRTVQDHDYVTYKKWQAWEGGISNTDVDIDLFNRMAVPAQEGRNFAITNSGYLGLIPEKARPGDHLVLMPGGKAPYILRRVRKSTKRRYREKKDGIRRYEFIGDCYIHGIMHGETWDESKLEKIIMV